MADEKTLALETVKRFLRGLAGGLPPFPESRKQILESSFAVLSHPNELLNQTIGDSLTRAEGNIGKLLQGGAHTFREALVGPEAEVWIYEDLAAVIAGYSILVDNNELSAGVNVFGLIKTDGEWRIAGIYDTQWAGGSARLPISSEPVPEAVEVVERFLGHLKTRDLDEVPKYFLPGGGATNSRKDGVKQNRWPELVEYLKKTVGELPPDAVLEEKNHDIQGRSVGDIAFVWTRYTVDVNDVPVGQGACLYNLLKQEGRWIISGFQDTVRPVS